ncbi:unnamed protein product, partial [Leptidea sinapis]
VAQWTVVCTGRERQKSRSSTPRTCFMTTATTLSLPRYERNPPAFVRVVKRRTTANKKERRRTQSINTAFTDLRECIPNVPPDTKLSKSNLIIRNHMALRPPSNTSEEFERQEGERSNWLATTRLGIGT